MAITAEKKTDRRTEYSKKVIRDALFELMKEKPLNKISVTEICSMADVNRSTFYTYYEDIFDLHRKIIRNYFEMQQGVIHEICDYLSLIGSVMNITVQDMYNISIIYFTRVYENRELFKFIFSSNSTNTIHISSGKVLFHAISPYFYKEDTQKSQKAVFKKAYTFIQGGLTAILIDWLNKGCAEPVDDIARHTAAFCFGALASEIGEYNFNTKEV